MIFVDEVIVCDEDSINELGKVKHVDSHIVDIVAVCPGGIGKLFKKYEKYLEPK